MRFLRIIPLLLFFLSNNFLFGQEEIAGIYADSTGQVYIQAKKPAYFFIAPTANPAEKINIPNNDPKSNPMYFDGNGVHYVRLLDPKTNTIVKYKIFADGIPPKVSIHFSKGLIMNSNLRYYTDKGAIANLVGKDNMSGVKEIYFSVNNESFRRFTSALVFFYETDYHLRVFSVDNVGNVSDTVLFRVITAVNSVVQMNNIYFDTGSANLRPESKKELNEFAEALTQYPEIKIEIRAHTDSRGDANFNQQLSELRAKSVVN